MTLAVPPVPIEKHEMRSTIRREPHEKHGAHAGARTGDHLRRQPFHDRLHRKQVQLRCRGRRVGVRHIMGISVT